MKLKTGSYGNINFQASWKCLLSSATRWTTWATITKEKKTLLEERKMSCESGENFGKVPGKNSNFTLYRHLRPSWLLGNKAAIIHKIV